MTHIRCVMSSHKPIRIYMGGLILSVNTLYRLFCFYKLFPMVCKGLTSTNMSLITAMALALVGTMVYARFPPGNMGMNRRCLKHGGPGTRLHETRIISSPDTLWRPIYIGRARMCLPVHREDGCFNKSGVIIFNDKCFPCA